MKKVFVCSPYRADTPELVEANVNKAKTVCSNLADYRLIPIAPHIYFTQFMDDNLEIERLAGIDMGIELMKDCSAVLCVVEDDYVSEGMRAELSIARSLGIPIFYSEGVHDSASLYEVSECLRR